MPRFMFGSIVALSLTVCAEGAVAAADEDSAVRDVLKAYMSSMSFPDPAPLDPQIFAEDIEGFASDGKTYRGRDAFLSAFKSGIAELEHGFVKFAAEPKDVILRRSGDMAWIACRIELSGTRTQARGAFHRTIRTTFVLRKQKDRWRIVHEHSSRLPQGIR